MSAEAFVCSAGILRQEGTVITAAKVTTGTRPDRSRIAKPANVSAPRPAITCKSNKDTLRAIMRVEVTPCDYSQARGMLNYTSDGTVELAGPANRASRSVAILNNDNSLYMGISNASSRSTRIKILITFIGPIRGFYVRTFSSSGKVICFQFYAREIIN